ncbi:MAG: 3'-5' exonuclease domain-containing protein 2 [Prolixibacteraceae bacterium]|nr:3'-5' exonuclease domain-containing protein 2 [Prolixibacteraceae bacterium]
MYRESISKEELGELPLKQFEGDIFLIDEISQVNQAVDFLSKQEIVGFDTETRPSFKKGKVNKVALLQLSTDSHAFLFRVNKIGLPEPLKKLLQSDKIIKPGIAIRDDIKVLQELNGFKPGGFIELQDEVKDFGIQNFSLKKLAGIILGIRISKAQQLSNWEAATLTPPQMVYAATDAWVSLKIYKNLFSN